MTTLIPEENGTLAAAASAKKPKVKKKPHVAPRRPDVAPAKAKSAHKAAVAKKATKGRPQPRVAKARVARAGSKTSKMLDLLKRPGGATSKELMKATGWLPHSVRGFLSGTVGKKMGLTVISTRSHDGERTYSVEA
jgi:Protein of unknown function (DUF3489)